MYPMISKSEKVAALPDYAKEEVCALTALPEISYEGELMGFFHRRWEKRNAR